MQMLWCDEERIHLDSNQFTFQTDFPNRILYGIHRQTSKKYAVPGEMYACASKSTANSNGFFWIQNLDVVMMAPAVDISRLNFSTIYSVTMYNNMPTISR